MNASVVALLALSFFSVSASAAQESPRGVVFEGRAYDAAENPGLTYTTNTVTLTGITGSVTAICSGDCTAIGRNGVWGGTTVSGFVANDTIAIRQSANTTGGGTKVSTVTVGTTASSPWTVTTIANTCGTALVPGAVCSDGSVYAGVSPNGNLAMYTTPCDVGQSWTGSCTGVRLFKTWNNASINYTTTGFTSTVTGEDNTDGLSALVDAGSVYQAADYCNTLNLFGHTDWYLPSSGELGVVAANAVAIGNFLMDGTWYWASTETAPSTAAVVNLLTAASSLTIKNSSSRLMRCVRK